jgi:hypothetical protein
VALVVLNVQPQFSRCSTPVWRLLKPDASLEIRKGNDERLFDEGRRKVRAWEKANAPSL